MAAITWLTVNTRSANSGTALTIHGEFCFLRGVDTLKSHLRINIRSEFSDNEENSCQNWKRLLGPAIPENFGPTFRWVRTVIQGFFSVLPRHVLWLVQETRAILSTNQITNLEPSAPGHSYFPALQAVCLCGPWSPIGHLWHFFLILIALISQLMQLRITFDCQLKSVLFYVLESSAFHVILK